MAALDFGMALAKGMLPKSEKAQKDLLNLAGGRNVFKSEDWWNEQVDKQISSGYRDVEGQDQYYKMPSGEYAKGIRGTSYYRSGPFGIQQWGGGGGIFAQSAPPRAPYWAGTSGFSGGWSASETWSAPEGAVFTIKPGSNQKQYDIQKRDRFSDVREDFTAGELSDIEAGAKAGAKKLKAQTEASKASQKRLKRGTGGLVGKAVTPQDTGLSPLGVIGLGLETDTLGRKFQL